MGKRLVGSTYWLRDKWFKHMCGATVTEHWHTHTCQCVHTSTAECAKAGSNMYYKYTRTTCVYMYYVYTLVATCTLCVHMRIHVLYVYVTCICIASDMCMHIHIYIHIKQFWFVCSMCQTCRAQVFLIGCARHLVAACSQLGSRARLPTLCPALVPLLPALAHSAMLVSTHWHVRVPVLWNCGEKCFLEPLVSHPVR